MDESVFSSIHPSAFDKYAFFWESTPQHSSDYTLTNLWAWKDFYGLQWSFHSGLCWIRQTRQLPGSDYIFWSPVGDWYAVDWRMLPGIDSGMMMYRMPEKLCVFLKEKFGDQITVEETLGQWEYLYTRQDLLTLSGRRFDSKRNHLNTFFREYGEDYRPIVEDNILDLIILQREWCKWRECIKSPSLKAEGEIICDMLQSWGFFPTLVGGTLYSDNQLLAFSIGEVLDEETFVVHFEKGKPGIRGVYQAMNNCFVRYTCESFTYINREQDLGEEGLRKAKQSYYPVSFLKKNCVTIHP